MHLNDLFLKVEEYQDALGYGDLNDHENRAYRNDCLLALYQEVSELVDSTPWKPWRKVEDQECDIDNAKREIIDCLFFLFNVARTLGISGTELETKFTQVLENNYNRINNGYNKTSKE